MSLSVRRLQRATLQPSGTGSIYLTPASSSATQDDNITFGLRINPGTAVTVVQATINFNPAQLEYVSIDASSSPFTVQVQQDTGASSITIVRAILNPSGVSSDSLIANITFTALASSGTGSLTLSDVNAAFDGSYTNPSASGAAVTFAT